MLVMKNIEKPWRIENGRKGRRHVDFAPLEAEEDAEKLGAAAKNGDTRAVKAIASEISEWQLWRQFSGDTQRVKSFWFLMCFLYLGGSIIISWCDDSVFKMVL
jgi:hypothetical protein